jgi:hypothetical protein
VKKKMGLCRRPVQYASLALIEVSTGFGEFSNKDLDAKKEKQQLATPVKPTLAGMASLVG